MSGSKVLVFGSFTEDETRAFMSPKSSQAVEKAVTKKELQFGSLNLSTGITFGNFNNETSSHLGSADGKVEWQPAEISKKSVDGAANGGNGPVAVETSKEDGDIDNSGHVISLSNVVEDIKPESISLTSLQISQTENGLTTHSNGLNFHVLDCANVEEENQNGNADSVQVHATEVNAWKSTNGDVVAAPRDLQPRGLINSGNLCFLNSTLQALASCSPFFQLLQELKTRYIPKVGFPTLTAFVDFVSLLDVPTTSNLKKDVTAIATGRPFSPAMFEGVLKNFSPDLSNGISGRPRQEDAQEFLSFVMDKMHEELLNLNGQSAPVNGPSAALVLSSEDDEWETVGPKNKTAVTRTQSFVPSEISGIFGGQVRSEVKARGNKASATVQPFLLLHLDIYPDAVHTIEDALRLYSAPENLEGYRTVGTGKAGVVSARKSVKIHTLSKIMILHLKRFSYGSQGSTKLHKSVRFPLEFILGRELLVYPSTEGRKYELVATITHHGRDHSKGHYTADARYPNGQWLRFDDASVTAIGTNKVLHDQAYVLFYKQV